MTSKPKVSKPEPTSLEAANQAWRDRLNNKTKPTSRGKIVTNIDNRFKNNSPSNTSRKAKKGHRPG